MREHRRALRGPPRPCVLPSQELDEEFLVVWEGFDSVKWRYLSEPDLREFLISRVADGFQFPLNPKWLLCDPGWFAVFQALCDAPHAKQSLDAWFPPGSGLRERFAQLHAAYPNGFSCGSAEKTDVDVAEWELRRYLTLQRAKTKLRAINRLRSLGARKRASE